MSRRSLVEGVVLAPPVAEDLVLHSPSRVVHLGGGVAHHVEGVGHQFDVGQHRGEDGSVGGQQIERARSDVTEPFLAACAQPVLGCLALSIRHDVEQLALLHVHDRRDELRGAPLAALHHEVLVESEGGDVAGAPGARRGPCHRRGRRR